MTTAADTGDRAREDRLDPVLGELVAVLGELGRDDLRTRAQAARVRASRPTTVVCVVGEFKQGKSSLVNGLVGDAVCPVDDDIATSTLTLVRYGDQPMAVVRYRGDVEPAAERVPIEHVASVVTEANDSGSDGSSAPAVERVDIAVPSSLLADGLAIVDTPGMGGLGAGHAAATLSFLPFADGLIFVSDATSELTATELAFLQQARDLCPNVILATPKTDLAPEWRRIVELDEGHLTGRRLDVPVIPVSSALRSAAFASRDRELNERSGYPALLSVLDERIISPARHGAAERAGREAIGMVDTVVSSVAAERDALDDPDALDRLRVAADEARQRLDALRSGGARWQTVLGDRITDLSTDVSHTFRGSIRETTRRLEEQIEGLKTAEEWDDMARILQSEVADAVTRAFTAAERGRIEIRDELADLLAADDVVGPRSERRLELLDTSSLWRSRGLDPSESGGGKAFRTGITGLRGAQGGVLMLGVSTQFLPQAAAVFLASNPVLLGAGALFGGFQLLEDRKRRLQARRQSARTQLRQFTDDVQFEVSNELTKLLRDVQRDLRDEFVELIGELQRSWTAAAEQAQQAASQGAEAAARRRDDLGRQLERLDRLRTAIDDAVATTAAETEVGT